MPADNTVALQSLSIGARANRPDRAVVAGWADAGLRPETFWLGYATITAAGWRLDRALRRNPAAFYRLFYGDRATNMNRLSADGPAGAVLER
jgi:hypothetical protein